MGPGDPRQRVGDLLLSPPRVASHAGRHERLLCAVRRPSRPMGSGGSGGAWQYATSFLEEVIVSSDAEQQYGGEEQQQLDLTVEVPMLSPPRQRLQHRRRRGAARCTYTIHRRWPPGASCAVDGPQHSEFVARLRLRDSRRYISRTQRHRSRESAKLRRQCSRTASARLPSGSVSWIGADVRELASVVQLVKSARE